MSRLLLSTFIPLLLGVRQHWTIYTQVNFKNRVFLVPCLLISSVKNSVFHVEHSIAYACSGCNGCKAAKIFAPDPLRREMVSLFHPRSQSWYEHFRWSDDKTQVVGITSTGRATIEALALNRKPLVNLRRVLLLANEHLPQRQ